MEFLLQQPGEKTTKNHDLHERLIFAPRLEGAFLFIKTAVLLYTCPMRDLARQRRQRYQRKLFLRHDLPAGLYVFPVALSALFGIAPCLRRTLYAGITLRHRWRTFCFTRERIRPRRFGAGSGFNHHCRGLHCHSMATFGLSSSRS